MLKQIISLRKDNALKREKYADFVSRKFGGLDKNCIGRRRQKKGRLICRPL
jgi:hypothetical protein